MRLALGRSTGAEMTADARFSGRVRRLTAISTVALGVIWGLAVATLDAGTAVNAALFVGWLLMPTVLGASLARPAVRWLVAVPATLVTLGLLGICLTSLPTTGAERVGWLLTTAGILLGGMLGLWFWYRLIPVPESLNDPYSVGRWIAVGAHVGLVAVGLMLIALGAAP